MRTVLELAGVKNAFGKQLGSANPLNNARATLVGLDYLRTPKEVAAARDLSAEEMIERIKSGVLGSPETPREPVCLVFDKRRNGVSSCTMVTSYQGPSCWLVPASDKHFGCA